MLDLTGLLLDCWSMEAWIQRNHLHFSYFKLWPVPVGYFPGKNKGARQIQMWDTVDVSRTCCTATTPVFTPELGSSLPSPSFYCFWTAWCATVHLGGSTGSTETRATGPSCQSTLLRPRTKSLLFCKKGPIQWKTLDLKKRSSYWKSAKMFHIYWPITTLLAAVALIAVVLTLKVSSFLMRLYIKWLKIFWIFLGSQVVFRTTYMSLDFALNPREAHPSSSKSSRD